MPSPRPRSITTARTKERAIMDTNINVIGFCSVLGAILILCITSYQVERIFNAGKLTVTSVRHPKRTYASIKTSLTDFKVQPSCRGSAENEPPPATASCRRRGILWESET